MALGHVRHQTVGETMQSAGATSLHQKEITFCILVGSILVMFCGVVLCRLPGAKTKIALPVLWLSWSRTIKISGSKRTQTNTSDAGISSLYWLPDDLICNQMN